MNRFLPQRALLLALLRRTQSIVMLVLLAACATLPASSTTIIKSPNDHREYRAVTLPNGLISVLVSDPSTDKSAAALAVYRGSYDDPEGRAGLAHFLEHMLFLGTTKYPDVDDYQNFITTHGGTFNAYTASDHTNFFFDIQTPFLEGGLDRFAQFFIAPTFDAAYVEREKNAVNSEYQLYLKDDDWRAGAVEKQVMSQTHPGARFSVGSLDTLSGDVRTDLVEFYRTHYSADQMALVVLGSQSLDQLQAWVTEKFSAIPRRPIAKPAPIGPMFEPGTLPRKLTYQTVKDSRQVTYNFPVPNLDPYFREKPGAFVANLLGHEGVGSLHAQLKARGWIESLGASAARFDADNALVMVSIELTEDGSAHIDDITRALFDYIALIRTDGIAKWRYEEQAKVAGLAFRFQESSSPMSFVYNTAPNLRLYPVKDVLEGPYLMEHYDEALIRRYVDALRPDNLLLEVSGQKVDADKIEPWFQVPYGDQKLATNLGGGTPAEFGLALPPPNEFLPTNLKLETQPESVPKRVDSTPGLALWWAPDTSFGTPRATMYLRLDVAGGFRTPTRRGLREPLRPPRSRCAQYVRVSGRSRRSQLRHRRAVQRFPDQRRRVRRQATVAARSHPRCLREHRPVAGEGGRLSRRAAPFVAELRRGPPVRTGAGNSVAGDDRGRLAAGTVVRRAGRRNAGTSRGVATRPPESLWRTGADARQRQFGGSRACGARRHLDAACRRGRCVVEYRREIADR